MGAARNFHRHRMTIYHKRSRKHDSTVFEKISKSSLEFQQNNSMENKDKDSKNLADKHLFGFLKMWKTKLSNCYNFNCIGRSKDVCTSLKNK